jgi:hypothetical protein
MLLAEVRGRPVHVNAAASRGTRGARRHSPVIAAMESSNANDDHNDV